MEFENKVGGRTIIVKVDDPDADVPEAMWISYSAQVYPDVLHDSIQYRELQRTFKAGMFDLLRVEDQIAECMTEEDAASALQRIFKSLRVVLDPGNQG